jgi:hypothetical protein
MPTTTPPYVTVEAALALAQAPGTRILATETNAVGISA